MAGTRSLVGCVLRQDPAAFDADAPVSALQTLVLRNNTQHLIDQSVQYRVNWAASTGSELATFSATDRVAEYAFAFPITNTDRNTYPSFDARVAIRLTGSLVSATVIATVTDMLSNTPIYTTSWGVVLTAATWNSDNEDISVPWYGRRTVITYGDPSVTGSSITASTGPGYIMGQLTVTTIPITSGGATGTIQLCGVQLREYLSQ